MYLGGRVHFATAFGSTLGLLIKERQSLSIWKFELNVLHEAQLEDTTAATKRW